MPLRAKNSALSNTNGNMFAICATGTIGPKYTKMTAVIVAFQRATSDPPEMPTTPGRPRDVQVAPQPLMAPGSPVTPRTGGMLPFVSAV